MLSRISITNYALIDELSIDLKQGFTSITGETGAGKSILIGALGLILGDRADIKSIADTSKKCIVEGDFQIKKYSLQHYFDKYDLDYLDNTVLRREISPSGRSRAFINDTPVSLNQLKEIGAFLIDIHSQHQTLLLNSQDYQLKIVDSFSNHNELLEQFHLKYQSYLSKKKILIELQEKETLFSRESDFKQFLFNEIEEAKISAKDNNIEEELKKFENYDEIQQKLNYALNLSESDDLSIISQLNNLISSLDSVSNKDSVVKPINDRLISLSIEFKDCISEIDTIKANYNQDFDDKHLLLLQERYNLLNQLFHKHRVNTVDELIQIKTNLSLDLERYNSMDIEIEKVKNECSILFNKSSDLAKKLTNNRLKVLPNLENELKGLFFKLGMPNAEIKIHTNVYENLTSKGFENFSFHFSANNGGTPMEISKIASGGELSRVMLCIKYVLAAKTNLPTVIFDEIDSGVSGEIAHKMASLMGQMSINMQVIGITHLPQVAAKGNCQLLVSKKESANKTQTSIRELSKSERINELAKMLSGQSITKSSLSNAQDLLNP